MHNISKIFGEGDGRVVALSQVNIGIEQGEYVAIYGQSGSGKSTLLNILAGLLGPTTGSVSVDGINLYEELNSDGLSRFRCEYVGFVFQAFNLLPYLTAYENTVLPLAHLELKRREKRRMATDALSRVGLSDRLDHLPAELSGGQQQRVAIARAIVNEPMIIMADEPTGNLDQKTRDEIMELFSDLNGEGQTVIMVTHDPDNIADAKRQVRLSDGAVLDPATIE